MKKSIDFMGLFRYSISAATRQYEKETAKATNEKDKKWNYQKLRILTRLCIKIALAKTGG